MSALSTGNLNVLTLTSSSKFTTAQVKAPSTEQINNLTTGNLNASVPPSSRR